MKISKGQNNENEHGHFGALSVAALLAVLIFLWLFSVWLSYSLEDQVRVFDILTKIATIIAICIGGLWSYRSFFRERLAEPRLKIEQKIETLRLSDGRHLIKVFMNLQNVGSIHIKLGLWRLRAEQLLPLTPEAEKALQTQTAFTDHTFPWRTVTEAKQGEFENESFLVQLEPGETDQAVGNLAIPSDVEVVQIYSHFQLSKEQTGGWPATSIVDLRQTPRELEEGERNGRGKI